MIKNFDFRRYAIDCQPYLPGESEATVLKRYGLDFVVKLGSNENPYGPYQHARQAIVASTKYLNRYPEDEYRALTAQLAKANQVKAENVALGSGAGNVIETVARLLLDEGDEVLIGEPTYRLYREVSRLMGAKVIPVKAQADLSFNLADFKSKITSQTKLIWLCNPNNPTGLINQPAEVEELIDQVADDVWVVVDEAYADFIEDGMRPDLVSKIMHKKVIIIRTFSKFFGLAGARVGYLVADSSVVKMYNTITEPFCVNRTGLFAALATLTKDQPEAQKVKKLILAQRSGLLHQLKQLGFRSLTSQANFILTKIPQKFGTSEQLATRLMEKGVIIRPASGWNLPTDVRITIGKPEENQYLVKRIHECL
ncbi:histidinol-phosphate transaminase [Liquorilactobacillus sicerae]|uniref:histidinol-phosphate transaminase n=1 Tax=Liquorilactobacillus sicerae TaxID=1416943 RepID=UPI00248159FE|nr:histidinol-phosphate transaminase [Liquorilactobacillus sicerae]